MPTGTIYQPTIVIRELQADLAQKTVNDEITQFKQRGQERGGNRDFYYHALCDDRAKSPYFRDIEDGHRGIPPCRRGRISLCNGRQCKSTNLPTRSAALHYGVLSVD